MLSKVKSIPIEKFNAFFKKNSNVGIVFKFFLIWMQNENAINPQNGRTNNLVVLRVQLGNPKKNDDFNVALMEQYKIYHKKEGSSQIQYLVNLVNSS
jgi:hypothetical protein